MRSLPLLLSAAAASVSLATGCPPAPTEQALPPPGLAGAPDAHAAPTALPGSGPQGVEPTGGPSGLPPGHPPLPADMRSEPSVPSAASLGAAPDAPGAGIVATGSVLETLEVPEYTYMRVQLQGGGEEWLAVTKTPVAVGDVVTYQQSIVMNDFPSRTLNRTFPRLVMGTLVGAPQKAAP